LGLIGAIAAGEGATSDAGAQTQLPELVVTTPSPVRRAPSRRPAAAAPTPQPAPSAVTQPTPIPGTSLQIPTEPSFVAESVMTRTELSAQPYAQLGDALATRPGIAATSFAPGASRPIIRGLSGFRVGMSENGLSTGDVSALSDDHAVPIDPSSLRQVEVVRGPATLRYGSQAIGAWSTPSIIASPKRSRPRATPSRHKAA
jgi:iron complex outermembrane recepter protein